MKKIQSIVDIITNSSTEVFVIKKEEWAKLPGSIKKLFDILTDENFFKEVECMDETELEMLGIPLVPFSYWSSEELKVLREAHTDKEILDFYKPLLKKAFDSAIYSRVDEDAWGFEEISKVEEELAKKDIKPERARC